MNLYLDFVKRLFDIVMALLLLIATAPLFVIVIPLIRLNSTGPAFLVQKRVGLHGIQFDFYKFRSMYTEHAAVINEDKIERDKIRGVLYKKKDDPRVTPLGRILRKYSIDELPQLFNVLKGDMSMVGPRPLVPYMLAPYPDLARKRQVVRPGLTGMWQVCNRKNNRSVLDMAPFDLDYINGVSLLLDLRILLITPFKITSGAY